MKVPRAIANREARATVAEFLQRFDPIKNRITQIYVCDGGANFYADALRVRRGAYKIKTMNDYVMANARGFWLYGNEGRNFSQQKSGQIWPPFWANPSSTNLPRRFSMRI